MSDSYIGMTTCLTLHNGRLMQKSVTAHPSAQRLAAFLDARLTADERAEAMAHFAACAECRHELTALRQVLESAPRTSSRRWIAGAAALAAALVFAVVLPRARGTDPEAPGPASGVRALDGSESIAISGPKDGDRIGLPLTLTWQSAGTDGSYLLVVTDSAGTEVLRRTGSDTSVTLPANIRLVPGARYFWSVEAKLIDGRSVKTGAHSFRLR